VCWWPAMVQEKNGQIIYGFKAHQFVVEDGCCTAGRELDEDPIIGLSLVSCCKCSRSAMDGLHQAERIAAMMRSGPRVPTRGRAGAIWEPPGLVQPSTRDMDQMRRAWHVWAMR